MRGAGKGLIRLVAVMAAVTLSDADAQEEVSTEPDSVSVETETRGVSDLDQLLGEAEVAVEPPEESEGGDASPEAESSSATDAKQARGYALEEVIVTAERREESLQDTPISLTAFGEERLEVEGINNLSDIGSKVPSLTIEPFPINNATLRIYIRGIGISDVQVTQDPPIGIYIDGVYVARATGTALDVAELQRIEVLRGPQGTLYGRNTTGGAVNLVTKRPSSEELEFKQKFVVGSRNQLTSKTTLNLPLTDDMAVKVAYLNTQIDGFIENRGPGGDFGDRDVEGFRLDYRWDIWDDFTVDYAFDRSDMEYFNYPYQGVRPAVSNKGQAEPVKDTAVANSKFSKDRFSSMTTFKPFEVSTTEIEGHSLILTKDFEDVQLKYIGAYRELDDAAYADLGGGLGSEDYRTDSHEFCGPAADMEAGGCLPLVVPKISNEQMSHEIQALGDLFGTRVQYVVGGYYFDETAQEDNTPLHHQFSAKIDEDVIPLLGSVILGVNEASIVNMLSQKYDVENEALAVFGQFTWTPPVLEDRLHLTFGGRHSEDSRKAKKFQRDKTYVEFAGAGLVPGAIDLEDIDALAPVLAGGGFLLPGDRSFDNIVGKKKFRDDSFSVVAEYDLTDEINVYGKMSEAYKSGGFNTRDPQRGATGDPATDDSGEPAPDGRVYGFGFIDGFDEENLRTFELGVKSELLDRRLRINADIFTSDFTNMQLNFILDGTIADTKVTNAGEAEMTGIEADISYLFREDVMLTLNYAWLDAKVTAAEDAFGNDVTRSFVFFSAPEHSYTTSVDWAFYDADWGSFSLNVNHSYMADRNGGARRENAVNTFLGEYFLFNGRISLNGIPLPHGMGHLGLWAKNILDEEYVISAIDNLPHADRAVIWGESRTFGLDLIYEF